MVHIRRYACGIWWPTYEVGAYSYFHSDLDLRTYSLHERIVIGKFCSIGDRVVISAGGMRRTDLPALYPFDVERTYQATGNTTIGNDVLIGSGATIVGGTAVGDGAIIASGAVVLSDVPAFAVVAGNPATVIRYRFSRAVVKRLVRIAWWHWPIEKIFANVDWFYRPIHDFLEQFDPAGGEHADGGIDRAHP